MTSLYFKKLWKFKWPIFRARNILASKKGEQNISLGESTNLTLVCTGALFHYVNGFLIGMFEQLSLDTQPLSLFIPQRSRIPSLVSVIAILVRIGIIPKIAVNGL